MKVQAKSKTRPTGLIQDNARMVAFPFFPAAVENGTSSNPTAAFIVPPSAPLLLPRAHFVSLPSAQATEPSEFSSIEPVAHRPHILSSFKSTHSPSTPQTSSEPTLPTSEIVDKAEPSASRPSEPFGRSCRDSESIASSAPSSRHPSPGEIDNNGPAATAPLEGEIIGDELEEDAHIDEEMEMSPSPSPIPGLGGYMQNPNDIVDKMSLELLDIRREISVHLTKERVIIEALKALHAGVPDDEDLSLQDRIFVEQTRVDFLKRELERLREARGQVENAVKEIEKRPPFACSALLDVFVGISKLSTLALDVSS
ncbi:hypothetical protein C8F01DRAFT_498693 [Mycena amicta]|nr:hypothetical protein C8F01DRAFT_498693 [Mycena amicta]